MAAAYQLSDELNARVLHVAGLLRESPESTVEKLLSSALDGLVAPVEFFGDAARGDVGRLESALQSGTDPNARDTRPLYGNGTTALNQAALHGQLDAVTVLLAAGAEIDARCFGGWTALNLAANHAHFDVVRTLLTAGADGTIANREGHRPGDRLIGDEGTEMRRLVDSWGGTDS